jgi:DNA-binding NtrC family response regulator
MIKPKILVVDDDAAVLTSLSLLLKQAGYEAKKASSPTEALKVLETEKIQVVLQDLNYSARQTTGEEGLELLRNIKSKHPQIPVILMTAWGSIALAVDGLKAGASDFITKPWTHQQILQSVKTALGLSEVASPNNLSRKELDSRYNFSNIIGEDPKLLKILEIIARVSQTDAPILITGESGTGKELIAEAIHLNSPRKANPLVRVNLGSVPSSLFESELFGHVKGAFTDAKADRKGRFEMADKGTIFLDEIGDMDFGCQVKLLRVLQDRTFESVGASKSKTVDVRVVSATNRNLTELVSKGEFREDLLYRLNLIALHLPPLRERKEDIPLIAQHFLNLAMKVYHREAMKISDNALKWFKTQTFSGNIRELKHLIERAVIISSHVVLDVEDFQNAVSLSQTQTSSINLDIEDKLPPVGSISLEEMEKGMIIKTIKHHQGNLQKAADDLGLSRFALYRRMEKYGIQEK